MVRVLNQQGDIEKASHAAHMPKYAELEKERENRIQELESKLYTVQQARDTERRDFQNVLSVYGIKQEEIHHQTQQVSY